MCEYYPIKISKTNLLTTAYLLLFHGIDNDIKGRVIPLHFHFFIHLNHLSSPVCSPDPDYTQYDHK